MDITGRISNIQRCCFHDGPGVRTLVFFKGCPLRCLWCMNPESQLQDREIMFFNYKCVACGSCSKISGKAPNQNRDCFECAEGCPTRALEIVGEDCSVEEIVDVVEKDRLFYESSGGGVTLSGGEPLMQADFCMLLLKELKSRNIQTAIETCGYASARDFKKVIAVCDQVLFDIKLLNKDRHRQWTGVPNDLILDNLVLAAQSGKSIVIRIPLIAGVNDDENFVKGTIDLMKRNDLDIIHLLPYHELGILKYQRLGRSYLFHGRTLSDKRLQEISDMMEASGIQVVLRG